VFYSTVTVAGALHSTIEASLDSPQTGSMLKTSLYKPKSEWSWLWYLFLFVNVSGWTCCRLSFELLGDAVRPQQHCMLYYFMDNQAWILNDKSIALTAEITWSPVDLHSSFETHVSISCHGIAETFRSSLTRAYVFFTVFIILVILHKVTTGSKLRSFQNVAFDLSSFSC